MPYYSIPLLVLSLLIPWIFSTIVIYLGAKLLGEEEGIGTAAGTAIVGAIINTIVGMAIGPGLIASLIAFVGWLVTLRAFYKIGWAKALLLAVVVWVLTVVVGLVLAVVAGVVWILLP